MLDGSSEKLFYDDRNYSNAYNAKTKEYSGIEDRNPKNI